MATSAWFDYSTYMSNKLAQLQKNEPAAGWTEKMLLDTFKANGFGGADGAERHFLQYGQNEDVAPNAFFNATEYLRAKAAEYFKVTDPKAVTAWQVAELQSILEENGMSAWSHYQAYGSNEGVNPSNQFDSAKYMDMKLKVMQATDPTMTLEKLEATFAQYGYSALTHFLEFGGKEGEVQLKVVNGKIPAELSVPEDQKVNSGTVEKMVTLTTNIDSIVVEGSAPTVIVGSYTGGTADTINAGDTITGGVGTDTFRISTTDASVIPAVKTTGVEVYEVTSNISTGTATLAFHGGSTGVETLRLSGGVNENFKVTGADPALKFEMINDASKVILAAATSYKDNVPQSVSLLANGVKNGEFTVANGTNTLNVSATGASSKFNRLSDEGSDLTTINITGNNKLEVTAALEKEVSLVDASAMTSTGGVKVDLAGAGTKFLGGAGNDVVKLTNTTTAQSQVLKGGAGEDTIVFASSAKYTDNAPKISEFETLRLQATSGSFAFDAINGLKKLEFGSATLTAGLAVSNLGGDTVVSVTGDVKGAFTTTLGVKTDTKNDVLDFRFDSANKTALTFGTSSTTGLKLTNYESLKVTSDGALKAAAANTLHLNAAGLGTLKNVNIAGDSNLTIDGLAKNINVNAADFAHKLDLSFAAADVATKITGGTADDIFRTTAVDKNLTLDGGEGTDTLMLTLGADTTLDGQALQNIKSIEKFDVTQGTHGFTLTDGGNFASVFAAGLDITVSGAATSGVTKITALDSYTGAMKVNVTETAALTGNIEVTTGKGNDTVTVSATAITTGDVIVKTGDGNDTINVTVGSSFTGTGKVEITAGKGADTITLNSVDRADAELVSFIIKAGDSLVASHDIINGFIAGDATSTASKSMVLDFDTAAIATSLTSTTKATIASTGLVTFTDSDMKLDAKFAYLEANVADGKTAFFVEGGNSWVFNADANGDSLVELVGVVGVQLVTTNAAATGDICIN